MTTAFVAAQIVLWTFIGATFAYVAWTPRRIAGAPTERELGASTATLAWCTLVVEFAPVVIVTWSACVLAGLLPFGFAYWSAAMLLAATFAGFCIVARPMMLTWRMSLRELALISVGVGNFAWAIALSPLVKP